MSAFQVIKPSQVVIGIAIPTSRKAFLAQHSAPIETHEYAKRYYNWQLYRKALGTYLSDVVKQLERVGARVVPELSVARWESLFGESGTVVIVIAHWRDSDLPTPSAIELSDGFKLIHELVDLIPVGFEGLLDLCVCHPGLFAKLVEQRRPKLRVFFKDVKISPDIWLLVYSTAILQIAVRPTDYATALENAMSGLIET